MRQADIGSYIPQVRPHIRRRDGRLFFMISKRPVLDLCPEEAVLYDSIDGQRSVSELESSHPGAGGRLLKWREAAVIELIPPMTLPPDPHLVVIEPHMDDAALSAGGRLLHRRGRCRITILSVVRWSNFTTYLLLGRNSLSVRDVTDLRQEESALAARLLGAEHRYLDWTDAPLRFCPGEPWSPATVERFKATPEAFVKLPPNPGDVCLLAEQLTQTLKTLTPDELWIPMGLGDHIDHRTTRSACLMMLAEARQQFEGLPVTMYEELPYSSASGHAAHIAAVFARCGSRLVRTTEDITDVFEEKLRLVSVYASQFKPSYIGPVIRGFAEHEGSGTGKLAEAYHRLEGTARLPIESSLSRNWAGLERLRADVRALLPGRAHCRRLRVYALPSCHLGKWKTDSDSLAAAFPNADLCVYVSDQVAWQATQSGTDKLKLRIVRGGWKRWIGIVWRELFHFRTPTIVLWRAAYVPGLPGRVAELVNMCIRLLFPFRRVLLAKTLGDFRCVLNEEMASVPGGGGALVSRFRTDQTHNGQTLAK